MDYKIFWTEEAIRNLDEILLYLRSNWGEKEVENFKYKLSKQIHLISMYPSMFPESIYVSRLRKAVLSKQTSIFYEIKDQHIFLVYIFINKKDIGGLK